MAFPQMALWVFIAFIATVAANISPLLPKETTAAKKTVTLSNIKQTGTATFLYMGDSDDVLPRQDNCEKETLLNKNLSNVPFVPGGPGCRTSAGTNGFLYRTNHYAWQKWILPYTKSVEIFFNSTREKDATGWNNEGQLRNQFGINTGLTGALNTYSQASQGQPITSGGSFRDSWIGGVINNLPSPSQTMLFMETNFNQAHIPHVTIDPFQTTQTTVPMAFKEYWRYRLLDGTPADCVAGTKGTQADLVKTTNGQLVVGFADGSAKSMPALAIMGKTPTLAELGTSITFGSSGICNPSASGGVGNMGFGSMPNTSINYPFWGFGQ
jgi:hypothetical protein